MSSSYIRIRDCYKQRRRRTERQRMGKKGQDKADWRPTERIEVKKVMIYQYYVVFCHVSNVDELNTVTKNHPHLKDEIPPTILAITERGFSEPTFK